MKCSSTVGSLSLISDPVERERKVGVTCSLPSQDAMLSPIHSTTVFVWVSEKGYSCSMKRASGSSRAGVVVYVIDCSCCKQTLKQIWWTNYSIVHVQTNCHNLNHMPYAELSPHTSKHITTLPHLWLIWSLSYPVWNHLVI